MLWSCLSCISRVRWCLVSLFSWAPEPACFSRAACGHGWRSRSMQDCWRKRGRDQTRVRTQSGRSEGHGISEVLVILTVRVLSVFPCPRVHTRRGERPADPVESRQCGHLRHPGSGKSSASLAARPQAAHSSRLFELWPRGLVVQNPSFSKAGDSARGLHLRLLAASTVGAAPRRPGSGDSGHGQPRFFARLSWPQDARARNVKVTWTALPMGFKNDE